MDNYPNIINSITRFWEIEPNDQDIDESKLKQLLSDKIKYLLINDFEKLVQIMYRLDVEEKLFHQTMQNNNLDVISDDLAELMIQRELKKYKWKNQTPD